MIRMVIEHIGLKDDHGVAGRAAARAAAVIAGRPVAVAAAVFKMARRDAVARRDHVFLALDQFGGHAAGAHIHVLGAAFAVAHAEKLVQVDGLALGAGFKDAFAGIVVPVGEQLAVVPDRLDAVFLVPGDHPSRVALVADPAGLVAVGIIGKAAPGDGRGGVGLRAGVGVGVGVIVGGLVLADQVAFVAQAQVVLGLFADVVDVVVAHRKAVGVLVARTRPAAGRGGQPVQRVIAEGQLRCVAILKKHQKICVRARWRNWLSIFLEAQ